MNEAPCWQAVWPDTSLPAAGFPPLEGVEHVDLYRATPETGLYSHHAQLARSGGVFYAAWSSHPLGEDGPGQRVLAATSADGLAWGDWFELFPPLDAPSDPLGNGRVLTANGWVAIDGALYAVAEVHDNVGFQSKDGSVHAAAQSAETPTRARLGHGRLARRVAPDGALGPAFWLRDDPPAPVGGRRACPALRESGRADAGRRICEHLAHPLNWPAWEFLHGTCWVTAPDGHVLCEPTAYRRPDGALVHLGRDKMHSCCLYARVSRDEGRTWSVAMRTDIPDSPSRSVAGTLPDGCVYLVGNQIAQAKDTTEPPRPWTRDPIVLSLAPDGRAFTWAGAIRAGAPPVRHNGLHKGPGFQYPSAIVAEGALWVLYSIGKEDVALSRVPLGALPSCD